MGESTGRVRECSQYPCPLHEGLVNQVDLLRLTDEKQWKTHDKQWKAIAIVNDSVSKLSQTVAVLMNTDNHHDKEIDELKERISEGVKETVQAEIKPIKYEVESTKEDVKSLREDINPMLDYIVGKKKEDELKEKQEKAEQRHFHDILSERQYQIARMALYVAIIVGIFGFFAMLYGYFGQNGKTVPDGIWFL